MPPALQRKIVDHDRLLTAVSQARASGKRIVHCHGCFDIVHPGHVRYLEFARQQGDVLIVSLTGDLDVGKGDNRPYIPQEFRAENLAAIMFVDYVYINPYPTASELLEEIRPDVYVKGREYERSSDTGFAAEKQVVERHGGRIIYSSGEVVFSSTQLISTMPRGVEMQSRRLFAFCESYDVTALSLGEVMDRFRGLRVVVVGDIVLDRYVTCDAVGLAGEGPMISLAHRDEQTYVGGAAIVARHVAALGAKAFLLSAGAGQDDPVSGHLTKVLSDQGVESQLIHARPTIVEKTRFLADEVKLFKLDKAARVPLDSVAQKQAAGILEQQARSADAVIFCDFGYGMISDSLLQRVLPTLRHNIPMITADVSGGRANLLNFKNADLLSPTEREARAMLNDYDGGLSSVAWEILRQTQARHMFITLEKRGLLVFERRNQDRNNPDWSARLRSELLPAFADHAVDRLGCGDALLAASTLALAAGANLMQAAYLGNAAAAIEVGLLGNHPVKRDQLRDWLQSRPELHPRIQQRAVANRGLIAAKPVLAGADSASTL